MPYLVKSPRPSLTFGLGLRPDPPLKKTDNQIDYLFQNLDEAPKQLKNVDHFALQ
jgi:hypothetical protein